jgi:putative Ca2+/H+ antiporter (TMEM165/GDT1 family)
MNYKTVLSTFLLTFLSEFGDKSQMTIVAVSTDAPSKMTVWAAACLGLVVSAGIDVLAGDAVSRAHPRRVVHFAAAAVFLWVGAVMLARELWK